MMDLFLTVLEISASVSLIIALLLFISPLLNRRYASKWKYLIWIFLAARLLIPFNGAEGRSAGTMEKPYNGGGKAGRGGFGIDSACSEEDRCEYTGADDGAPHDNGG